MQITKAWSIPNLAIQHTSCSTQQPQERYQHLQGIDIPLISSSDITLIGADMPQLLVHDEYKAGKGNEPYGVCTELCWVLMAVKSSKLENSIVKDVCLVH